MGFDLQARFVSVRRCAFRSITLLALVGAVMALGPALAQAGSGGSGPFTPGAPGAGDPYFPLDGNGGYDVRHYALDVKYDPRHGRPLRARRRSARARRRTSRGSTSTS